MDLSGYFLTDDLNDTTQFEIPAGVTIGAGAYLLFWADNDPEQGSTHTTFKLSRGGEELGLFAPISEGNGVADAHIFGEQAADVSKGRDCDASETWAFFTTATPGVSNGSCCAGDITGDGQVTTSDLTVLLGNFGMSVPPGTGDDFNNDGTVTTSDLTFLLGAFGTVCTTS